MMRAAKSSRYWLDQGIPLWRYLQCVGRVYGGSRIEALLNGCWPQELYGSRSGCTRKWIAYKTMCRYIRRYHNGTLLAADLDGIADAFNQRFAAKIDIPKGIGFVHVEQPFSGMLTLKLTGEIDYDKKGNRVRRGVIRRIRTLGMKTVQKRIATMGNEQRKAFILLTETKGIIDG